MSNKDKAGPRGFTKKKKKPTETYGGMKAARDAAAIIGVPLAVAVAFEVATIDALGLQPKIKSKVTSAVNKIKKIDKSLGGKITQMKNKMSAKTGGGGVGMFTQFGKLNKRGIEKIRQKLM